MYTFTYRQISNTVDDIASSFVDFSQTAEKLHFLVIQKTIALSKLDCLSLLFPHFFTTIQEANDRIEHIFKSRRLQIASESDYQDYLKLTFIGDLGRPPVASPVSVGQGGNHPVLPPPFQFSPPPYDGYPVGAWSSNPHACSNCFHMPLFDDSRQVFWRCTCGHLNESPLPDGVPF